MSRRQIREQTLATGPNSELIQVAGAAVLVHDTDGNPVDVYAGDTGGTPVAQPIVSGEDGWIIGWLEPDAPRVLDLVVSDNSATAHRTGAPARLVSFAPVTNRIGLSDGATTLAGLTDVDLSGVTPVDGTALLLAFDEAEAKWKAGSALPGSALLGAVVGNWDYGGTQYDWLTVTDLDFAGGAGSNNFSVGSAIGVFGAGVTGTGNVNVSVGGLRSLTSGRANISLGPSLASLQTGSDNFGAGGALGAMILGDNALAAGPGTMESYAPTADDLPDDPDHIVGAFDTQLVAWGAGAGAAIKTGRSLTLIGDGAGNNPYSMGSGGTRAARRHVHVGTWTGLTAEMDVDDVTTLGWHALGGGTGATAGGSTSVADGAYASVFGYATSATGDGSAAMFTDSTGQGATSDTPDLAVIGTALHTVRVPGTLQIIGDDSAVYDVRVVGGTLQAVPA